MKKFEYIFTEGDHKWAVVSRDPDKANHIIDTNEYLILDNNEIIITDPGGVEIFPSVFSSISREINPKNIKYIFASHQDPDIISSLSLWLEVNSEIKCYTSWIWNTFLPHFGGNEKTFISIPDKGQVIQFNTIELEVIPAHYLHSSGNFHLYDPKAKILFSGDIGAALLPFGNRESLFVGDFDEHIKYATKFHQRWMGSNEAKNSWCEHVSKLPIEMLCPQHGLIYAGKDVGRFINWFFELEVGITSD
ncbi:MAG: MBL fold metallo-hydrolase [Leptospiraceae bacterium]|nr:MBL fold metallo-hydrolase [Leptospiraceae bacterium]MCP5495197.1 MBL fold metallo-hydrolase [Leptospiraceae bacterium]